MPEQGFGIHTALAFLIRRVTLRSVVTKLACDLLLFWSCNTLHLAGSSCSTPDFPGNCIIIIIDHVCPAQLCRKPTTRQFYNVQGLQPPLVTEPLHSLLPAHSITRISPNGTLLPTSDQ